ncbi:MAG TPA: lysylphosphatidylglycerol synthase transmembrane domain-containing protein [Anaerolineales bacterium]|nr:lysylphosphatidylglycerol synthase transmembrane domain-containing protein [Anaerolineales bacterium]
MKSSLLPPSADLEDHGLQLHPALSAPQPAAGKARDNSTSVWRLLFLYAVLGALLYFALRNAPLIEIWRSIAQLRLSQIGILFLLNALVIAAMTARWWVIVHAENPGIPFLPLVRYRLAVFGLSYFTPGPQVGGEPLQVIYLQRHHGISFARATSAVIMDKLLEFLANFILIAIGLTAAVRVGLISSSGIQTSLSLIPLAAFLLWPIIHLVLLYHGRYPVSSLLRLTSPLIGSPGWVRLVIVAERMAASFTRRRLGSLLTALGFSLVAWTGMALEYFLMASFLNADLSLEQTLAALTAALVAFLMPLPGGLGALEASQVYALQAMGYAPALGISISLIMRGRDILNGVIGLLLAGKGKRKHVAKATVSQNL